MSPKSPRRSAASAPTQRTRQHVGAQATDLQNFATTSRMTTALIAEDEPLLAAHLRAELQQPPAFVGVQRRERVG